jgi:hypothetical protein
MTGLHSSAGLRRLSSSAASPFQKGNNSPLRMMFFLSCDIRDMVWQSLPVEGKRAIFILPEKQLRPRNKLIQLRRSYGFHLPNEFGYRDFGRNSNDEMHMVSYAIQSKDGGF